MMPPINRAWILAPLLAGRILAGAQDGDLARTAVAPSVDKEWTRLQTLIGALITEEGTRKLFSSHRGLGECFSSEEHFSTFVSPWRSRLISLPLARREAKDVDVETRQKEDGTTSCMVTFHHQQPAHAITILKTVWQEESLLKVVFMKGFSHIDSRRGPSDRLRAREEAHGQWGGPEFGDRR